jgi:hypothetical protein
MAGKNKILAVYSKTGGLFPFTDDGGGAAPNGIATALLGAPVV